MLINYRNMQPWSGMMALCLRKTYYLIPLLSSTHGSLCDTTWLLALQPSHPHPSQWSRGHEKEKNIRTLPKSCPHLFSLCPICQN